MRKKKIDFYRKLIASSAVTTVAIAGLAGQAPVSADVVFKDVSSNHYAKEAISHLVAKGIVKGFPDGTFRPQQELLREHAAALLVRSLELQSSTTSEQYFKDVPKTSSYFGAVSALKDAGIFLGDHNGNFNPKTSLTREEMATILVRAFNLKAQAGVEIKLTDLDKVSASHKENVKILYQNGITIGYGDGSFRPKTAVNRADFAVFITRSLSLDAQGKTVEAINESSVTIEGMTYTLSSNLQDLFTSNKESLIGSKINFQTSNNEITGITYLELATASKVFDGKGFSLTGNVKVSASNVTVKNLTVTGNLEVSEKASGTITFDQVEVKGATALTSTAGLVSAANTTANNVTFKNSTLTNIKINNKGLAVNFQGTTTVKALEVQTDATLKADQSVVLPSVTVAERAQNVTLEATITDLTVKNRRDLQLKTVGNINQLTVESLHPVTLDLNGKIQTLAPVKNSALTLNLSQGSTVGELKLPEGVQAKDVIKNYDQVKQAFGVQPGGSFVPNPGPSIPAPDPDPTPTVVEWDSAENPFANNVVYATNFLITPVDSATYGADAAGNEAVIEGNVEIKGDITQPITLKNLVIKGKLVLDAGDQSSVVLENVQADEVEILSGKKGTIHLNGVQFKSIIVKDDNGVRLSTNGVNVIDRIEVDPTSSSSESDIELAGNFNNAKIVVKDETKITAKAGFAAQAIEIETKNASSEVTFVSTTGSFADVQEVTVKKAATVNSSGNTQIQNIVLNIPQSEQNNTVTLKGENLNETEVSVKTASTLNVNAGVGKISTEANVTIGGEKVAEIQAFEKTSNANVTAANESVQSIFDTIKQQAVDAAIANIQKLPELSAVGFNDIASVQTARRNVNTAISFGATNADFVVEEVNYLEKLTEIEASLAAMMSAITEVQKAIRALPTNPGNVQAIALEGLQTRVTAVNNAIVAAKDAGVTQTDIEKVRDYARVVAANQRVEQLVAERNTAREVATTKLAQIPAVDEITFSNLLEVQQLLVDVRKAIAEAADKGVTIEGLAPLTAADTKVKQLLAERDEAVRVAKEKIELIPAEITYSNIEATRPIVEEAKTAVEAAKAKAAVDNNISNLAKLTAAIAKIAQLDEGTREAITAANGALAALPVVADVNFTNLADTEAKVAAAKQAIETAKEKNATDADFENLALLTALEEKVAALVAERAAAIEVANEKIAIVPTNVTFANLAAVKELIEAAKTAIAEAKTKGATDAHFVGLPALNQAIAKVAQLEEEKRQAIVAVNEALASLPVVTDVTYTNLAEVEAQLATLADLIATAKAKTAVDADFVGLEKIVALKERIDNLQQVKAEALNKANQAIASIPALEEITFANLVDTRTKLDLAVTAVAEAKQFGVTEADITGFESIALVTEKVEALEALKAEAIAAANKAISDLPAMTEITYANLEEMNEVAQTVRAAVTAAKEKGATDAVFENLSKLTAFEAKVNEMLESKAIAIQAANTAINTIPAVEKITAENVEEVQALIATAKEKVAVAKEHGARLADFPHFAKIAEAQAKVDLLLTTLEEAIEQANELIGLVPLVDEITFATLVDATEKTAAARAAVNMAKELGATDSSFEDLIRLTTAEAKVAELTKEKTDAIARANEALAEIPEVKDITVANFRALVPKIQVALDLVAEAKAKGALAADFVGKDRLQPAKDKVSELQAVMQAEITIVNQAIANLPALAEVTYQSLDAAKSKLVAVELAIQSAKAAGAVDADFTDLEKYVAVKERVAELVGNQQAALQAANEKLALIPVADEITYENINEVRQLIAAAKEAVEFAKSIAVKEADFSGLAKVSAAVEKIAQLEEDKRLAIEAVNQALATLPQVEDVTVETVRQVEKQLEKLFELIAIAKAKTATDDDFVGLEKVAPLQDRIEEINIQKLEAIEAANAALAEILAASEITVANFRAVSDKIKQAESLITDAKAKGAVEADFVGLDVLAAAKEAVAVFFEDLYGNIVLVNLLISELPAVTEINYENLAAVKERVEFLEGAIERAIAVGAYESEFENLAAFTAVQAKVKQLVEAKSAAIKIANEKITLVPIQSLITPQNLADTKAKLVAAQQAVADARTKGAVDGDFVGISKLALAEAKIQEIEAAQVEALAKANEALANLPLASEVNEGNLQEVRMKVSLAQNLVKQARDLGVAETQLVGLDKLAAVLERLEEFGLSLEEALAHANELLVELKDFGTVTSENAAEAQVVYLTAYLAVQEAFSLGVQASDFDQEGYERYLALEAELESFKPARPRHADPISSLAEIVRNPEGFDYYHLQTAVNDRVEPALLEEYRQEIIEFLKGDEELTLAILKGLVQIVHERGTTNGQEALDVINDDIANLTYSLLSTLVWTYEENFENARDLLAAAKAAKQGSLSRNEVITIVQDSTHAYAVEQVLTNPEFTINNLSWAVGYREHVQFYPTYFEKYKQAIRDALANGLLTQPELRQLIIGVNEAAEKEKLAAINGNLPAMTPDVFEPLVYVNNWMFPLFLDALVKLKAEVQRDLTAHDLNQVYNSISRVSALDALNNNPETIDYYALQQIGINELVFVRFAEYRQALVEARKDGVLTIEAIQVVILTVNSQSLASAVERINNNCSNFSFTDLQEVVSWAKAANLARYREAMTNRFSDMTLTRPLIEEVVGSVDRFVALETINLTPTNVSFELLRDALAFRTRDGNHTFFSYYRDATVRSELVSYYQEAINKAAKPFTIDTLADLVIETNNNIQETMLDQINKKPAEVTYQMLQIAGIYSARQEYLNAYRVALVEAVNASEVPLTKQEIENVVRAINQTQALARINANPLTFSISDLFSAINVYADQNLLSYYQQEINQRRTQKGANLTKQEVEAAVNVVNNNIRAIALEIVNDETETVSFEWLNRAAHNVRQQFMSQYRQALVERKSTLGWLTEQAVQQIIMSVNNTEMAKYINANAHFTYDDLWYVAQGYNIQRNLFNAYHEAITSHENYGSLTVEQITTIIQTVNGQSRLAAINNHPEDLTLQQLNQALNWLPIIREENFNAYKAAIIDRLINQEKPFTTVKELENLVVSINESLFTEALAEINDNPSGFSFEALTKLGLHVHLLEERLQYYRQVIAEKRTDKGTALTLNEIENAINEANQLAAELMELEALAHINANPDTFTFETLRKIRAYVVEDRLEYYRQAIKEKIAEKGGHLTIHEMYQAINRGNQLYTEDLQNIAAAEINANPDTFTFVTLLHFQWDVSVYEERLGHYRSEVKKKLEQLNRHLTVAEIVSVLHDANQSFYRAQVEAALKEINDKPTSFTFSALHLLVGVSHDREDRLPEYRQAIAAWHTKNGNLTHADVQRVVWDTNRDLSLAYINANPETFTMRHLEEVLNRGNVHSYSEFLNAYRVAIKLAHDNAEGKKLTVEDISRIVDGINKHEALQAVINNRTGFEDWELAQVIGWDLVKYHNLQDYRQAVTAFIEENGSITVEELTNLVQEVNESKLLAVINDNPLNVDVYTLRELFKYDYDHVYDFILWKNEEEYRKQLNDHYNTHGNLTKAQVEQIVIKVNEEVEAREVAEKLAVIVNNPTQFHWYQLEDLVGYKNLLDIYRAIDEYRTAINIRVQAGDELTKEDIIEIVLGVNDRMITTFLTKITEDLNELDLYELEVIINYKQVDYTYVNYNNHNLYKQRIQELIDSGEGLTVAKLRQVVQVVNHPPVHPPTAPPVSPVPTPEEVLVELELELEKYEDMATIAVGQEGDITNLIIRLKDGVEVNDTITLQVTGEQLHSNYLTVSETTNSVYLGNTNSISHSVTERVTLTFTKADQSVSKTIYVTIKVEEQTQNLEQSIKNLMKTVEGLFISEDELQPWVSFEVVDKLMKEVDAYIAQFPELEETDKLLDRAYEILRNGETKN
ncbi:S-layer homology domain-containing protein [Anaerobacillus alkaliphilus]|uniref:S-layer homology domain-containing protein n=1 Tax=Anaerobacillus alkaliphilus TaxID=1548597 RepID=UPI001375F057|nr:S-layer homology domain-containing protein [Anaerobacillus alkaliphilus]